MSRIDAFNYLSNPISPDLLNIFKLVIVLLFAVTGLNQWVCFSILWQLICLIAAHPIIKTWFKRDYFKSLTNWFGREFHKFADRLKDKICPMGLPWKFSMIFKTATSRLFLLFLTVDLRLDPIPHLLLSSTPRLLHVQMHEMKKDLFFSWFNIIDQSRCFNKMSQLI